MPKQAAYMLMWSPQAHTYGLYTPNSHDPLPITSESPVWFTWLDEISSFSFHSREGHICTVRKERVQRGNAYWYAYRRQHSKMVKRYLGRSVDLTIDRLEEIAAMVDIVGAGTSPKGIERSTSEPRNARAISQVPAFLYEKEQVSLDATPNTSLSMPHDLLETKLKAPHLRTNLVHRSHLTKRLQQGMESALMLVSAPAEFGKTTLLAQWLAESGTPVSWLSLEPEDNDPVRFLSYLIAALQKIHPQLGTLARALLEAPQNVPGERVLALLANDILYYAWIRWKCAEQHLSRLVAIHSASRRE